MEKVFILGVGCQKGGTTWVHSQLEKSKSVDMGFTKEYHVFDALYVPECKAYMENKFKRLRSLPLTKSGLNGKSQLLTHLNFYLDQESYFDYFDYLWHRGQGEITTVGDITPTYSGLPKEAFKEIKSGLEERGFKVKVIFLMRDPIERCWSMVRMQRRKDKSGHWIGRYENEQDHLRAVYKSKYSEIRTQYEKTIKNLEEVFDENDIFYSFYEKLFQNDTLSNLKDFLDIPDFHPDILETVNVSRKRTSLLELDDGLATDIFKHYSETFQYCESRFKVSDFWPSWRYV